ncbi:hypothetical protein KKI24_19820 [bacterium]|nr:hypothetical protein [bacterium]
MTKRICCFAGESISQSIPRVDSMVTLIDVDLKAWKHMADGVVSSDRF